MIEPNSKLFRDDPATYYVELGAKAERERIIKLLEGIAIETKNGEIAVMELFSAIKHLVETGKLPLGEAE